MAGTCPDPLVTSFRFHPVAIPWMMAPDFAVWIRS
jgi:hypothetical protein